MANFAKPTSASWVGPNGFNDGAEYKLEEQVIIIFI